jgi:hypothetical protein
MKKIVMLILLGALALVACPNSADCKGACPMKEGTSKSCPEKCDLSDKSACACETKCECEGKASCECKDDCSCPKCKIK